MRHGFIKVAAITNDIKVADTEFNSNSIIDYLNKADEQDVKIAVFPELCLTGYTCGELFLQDELLDGAITGLSKIAKASVDKDMLIFVGLPYAVGGKLYNVAAAIKSGTVLAFIPKKNLPNYGEFYEARHFTPGPDRGDDIHLPFQDEPVSFGTDILFKNVEMSELSLACELCEDMWVPDSPSIRHALNGATLIVNLSGSTETTGKDDYRRELISLTSAKLLCGYIYATAGDGESSTDLVFGGQNIIAEDGSVLAEKKRFENGMIVSEIDVKKLIFERRKMSTFNIDNNAEKSCHGDTEEILFTFNSLYGEGVTEEEAIEKINNGEKPHMPLIPLTRTFSKTPFVPSDKAARGKRCEEIIMIQAKGLSKRLSHIGCKAVVVGVSGGLDSTLALLVSAKAFDILGLDHEGIIAVTMPAFGTTDRTYNNALSLAKSLHTSLREINIKAAVLQHFKDIDHDEEDHNVVYENSQARERTQVLMDIANEEGGIVIGTGDMSELALGWATYNGDHMSMYAVNCSIPKTLVRFLVMYFADEAKAKGDEELSDVLYDVLDTPVSPELLPPDEGGKISQKTEDIVGPYELHDFFLYYVVRFGFTPDKIYRIACVTFHDEYGEKVIYKWLVNFYKRFFAQQYKRSCIPDGPKVGSVALSPRGDLRMPSDASVNIWMKKLEAIKPQ